MNSPRILLSLRCCGGLDRAVLTGHHHRHGRVPAVRERAIEAERLKRAIAACDGKLRQYRAALAVGADPGVYRNPGSTSFAGPQLFEVPEKPQRLSVDDSRRIVAALGDIATVLRRAHPDDKAEVYRQLRLRLVYDPETATVRADVNRGADRRD